MFDFTKRSRKILEEMAQMEARRLNSSSLEPEHIFLALLSDEDSVSARILKNLGINFERLRFEIENSMRRVEASIVFGKAPVSQRYKKIIDMSREEAVSLKNSYIGTEHLLLAIFRDGTSAGINSLNRAGIDYDGVKNEILRALGVKTFSEKTSKAKHSRPALDEFAYDLTQMAVEKKLDPVIGRFEETNRLISILSRKRKNNPILIGEAGVGKTAIVEGLAQRIISKQIPAPLENCRVLSLDMAAVVAGTKYRGEFEERLKRLVNEIKESKNTIIFIDEIHTIIGAGAAEGAIDAANILKPALAKGELQCIGATTLNEYRLHIEKDSALVRRFQSIMVKEPSAQESLAILHGLKDGYEKHHRVHFMDEAIKEAVNMSERYINGRFLPDKAIDILDEAGAMACLENYDVPADIKELEKEIEELNSRKSELVIKQEYEQAAAVRDSIIEKKNTLSAKTNDWRARENDYAIVVDASRIATVVSEITGIPLHNLEESDAQKLLRMEEALHQRIIGQNGAVSAVSKAIRRSRVGLSSQKKPMGSFIFLGPTGVGKTELAKALAEFLFNNEKFLIRVDMSEYMEKHSVARLIGSPPGYIGYDDGGQLSEKVRRNPYSVVLLDEIEKAHPDVLNILLQILDDGTLTDNSGVTVSFRDTIIIMTSNIGARDYQKLSKLGFSRAVSADHDKNERIDEELKRLLSPEFLNRIDEVVYFHKLEKNHTMQIVDLMLEEVRFSLLKKRGIDIEFSAGLKKFVIEKGYSNVYGARNIRRVIQREIEDVLAVEILKGRTIGCQKLQASIRNGRVHFRPSEADSSEALNEQEYALNSGSR
ncbi:MAG: ATP-dependent Clp protease ATP-binding subunit [Leptospirales bacterium]|nr:ATP-dependent Clp protease ATP-binding subunit [Leptospirales bacterium]